MRSFTKRLLACKTLQKPAFKQQTLKFISLLIFCLFAATTAVNAQEYQFQKVTENQVDWSGEYIIVYETGSENGARVYTGTDANLNHTATTCENSIIEFNDSYVTFTFAPFEEGYSIQVNGGTYDGTYLWRSSNSNGTDFSEEAVSCSVSHNGTSTIISSTSGIAFQHNKASGTERFRFYKSAQQPIQLYKKVASTPVAVPTPTFSVAAGYYESEQSVEISCTDGDAQIRYTLDGNEPTNESTLYENAITISTTTIIKAKAFKGEETSSVASATYTFPTIVENIAALYTQTGYTSSDKFKLTGNVTFVFESENGKYIYVKDETAGLLIYDQSADIVTTTYNEGDVISGLTGTLVVYSGLLELKPVADLGVATPGSTVEPTVLAGITEVTENIMSQLVTIKGLTVVAPSTNKNLTLTDGTNELAVYNQFNLTSPYEGLVAGDIVNFTGFVGMYNNLQVYPRSASDIVKVQRVATPTFSLEANTYAEVKSVTLACETADAQIYYTIDNEELVLGEGGNATLYNAETPISVDRTMTIKAIAVKDGMLNSEIATITYTIDFPDVENITFDPAAGSYVGTQTVHVTCTPEDATIYYTINGDEPTTESATYNSENGIEVATSLKIKVLAVKGGYDQAIDSAEYTITAPDQVVRPTITSAENATEFIDSLEITIASTTEEAEIFYTLDDSDPTLAENIARTAYNGPFYIRETATIKAYATKTDMTDSEVASANFTKILPTIAALTFAPEAGTYTEVQTVVLSCETADVNIFYTIDGSDPVLDGEGMNVTAYTEAGIEVATSMTIKAIATKEGYNNSEIATAEYIINLPVVLEENQYLRVTDLANLNNGDKVLIAARYDENENNYKVAHQRFNNDRLSTYDIVQENDIITTANDSLVWTININEDGKYTFTNANGEAIAYASGTTFNYTGNQNLWNVEAYTAQESAMVSGCQGYKIYNDDSNTRAFALRNNGVIGAYATSNQNSSEYNFAMSLFARSGEPVVEPAVAMPTFTPEAGTYTEVQNVEILCATEGAAIQYVLGEYNAESVWTNYETALSIEATTTINARAILGEDTSAVATAAYVINLPGPAQQFVRISSLEELQDGAEILIAARFDDNANNYRLASQTVTNNKLVPEVVTAIDNTIETSTMIWTVNIVDGKYTFTAQDGKILKGSSNSNVSLVADPTADHEWELSAITSCDSAVVANYDGILFKNVANSGRALALRFSDEYDVFGNYSVNNNNNTAYSKEYMLALDIFVSTSDLTPFVATPTFTLAAGTYYQPQTVEINCVTPGALIYYTTDGNDPTDASTLYDRAIQISESTTIKAIAIKDELSSEIASATYTIDMSPVIIVSADTLTFGEISETATLVVSSSNLAGNITVEVTGAFSVSAYSVAANVETDLIVTFTGSARSEGTITLTSLDVVKTVQLIANPLTASEGAYFPIADAQEDWSGDYLITYSDFAGETPIVNILNGVSTNNIGTYIEGAEYYNEGLIESNLTTEACKVTVAQTENGYSLYLNRQGYLGFTGTGNKLFLNENFTAQENEWTFAVVDGIVKIYNVMSNNREIQWNNNANQYRFACYAGTQEGITLYKLSEMPNVAMPQFSVAAGYYETAQSVEITCATAGASIYYTTDGTIPTNASTLYENAISVSENTTIKAIAYIGDEASFVATATYTFPVFVENIAALYEIENPGSAVYKLTSNVTFVYRKNANIYVQDATAGLAIYDNSNIITTQYTEGDVFDGLTGTLEYYRGLLQLRPTQNTAAATSNAGEVQPQVVTVEQLLTNNYVSQLVRVENVFVETGATYTEGTTGSNLTFAQNGSEAVMRNNFKTLDMTIADNSNLTITGIASIYDGTIQIFPRDNADVNTLTAVEENAIAVAVYPNPASDMLVVANAEGQNVEIINALGQVVVRIDNASSNQTINVSDLSNGTYFVKVGSEITKLNIVK